MQRACLLEVLRGRSPACADAAAKLFVGHDPLPTRGPSGAYAGIFREPVRRRVPSLPETFPPMAAPI